MMVPMVAEEQTAVSSRGERGTVYAVLLILLGCVGAHRFYLRKIATGVVFLLTMGFVGVGVIVDAIRAAKDRVVDVQGALVPLSRGMRIVMTVFSVVAIMAFFYFVVISVIAVFVYLLALAQEG